MLEQPFEIPVNFRIPYSNYFQALRFKKLYSILVVAFLAHMTFAIQFNDQLCFRAEKIGNIGPDGMLPAKFVLGS